MTHGNVDDYEILEEDFDEEKSLGQGAKGQVFSGVNKETRERVAIKLFINEPEDMTEVAILQKLDNENIVKLLAAGKMKEGLLKDQFIFILEFCCHGALNTYMKKNAQNGLDDESFLRLLKCIRGAYEYLYRKKILHRDIKPANILVTENANKNLSFKIADFDTARESKFGEKWKADEYNTGGTVLYWHPRVNAMKPGQQVTSTVSDKTYIDMWAIGTTLYEAATGTRAFQPFKVGRSVTQLRNALQRAYSLMGDGVISMTQKEDGEWYPFTQLPEGIQMSKELAHIVTPLIAHLLNKSRDPSRSVEFVMGYADAIEHTYETMKKMKDSPREDTQWKLEKAKLEEEVDITKKKVQSITQQMNELLRQNKLMMETKMEKDTKISTDSQWQPDEERGYFESKEEIQSITQQIDNLLRQNQAVVRKKMTEEMKMKELLETNDQIIVKMRALKNQLNETQSQSQGI